MEKPISSPYAIPDFNPVDALSDTSPMELRPQAFNARDLRMLNPQGMSMINQLFNRSTLAMGGRGDFVIKHGSRGVGGNLGW